MDKAIRILGVDPGSRLMGWGVVDLCGTRLTFVAAGVVKPPSRAGHPERLAILFRDLDAIITVPLGFDGDLETFQRGLRPLSRKPL